MPCRSIAQHSTEQHAHTRSVQMDRETSAMNMDRVFALEQSDSFCLLLAHSVGLFVHSFFCFVQNACVRIYLVENRHINSECCTKFAHLLLTLSFFGMQWFAQHNSPFHLSFVLPIVVCMKHI